MHFWTKFINIKTLILCKYNINRTQLAIYILRLFWLKMKRSEIIAIFPNLSQYMTVRNFWSIFISSIKGIATEIVVVVTIGTKLYSVQTWQPYNEISVIIKCTLYEFCETVRNRWVLSIQKCWPKYELKFCEICSFSECLRLA